MTEQPARSAVILCTLDRSDDLRRCLESIANARARPDFLVVVDGSADFNAEPICKSISSEYGLTVRCERSPRGLTRQRNLGLDIVGSSYEFVHFLDDDVEIHPDYFAEAQHAFDINPSAVGIGAVDVLLSAQNPIRRLYNWSTRKKQGSVTRSGVNYMLISLNKDIYRRVDWLSGCSMSFRSAAIQGSRFDERRNTNGDDLDFSLKLRARGLLLVGGSVRLAHHRSPVSRENALKTGRGLAESRLFLAEDFATDVSANRVRVRLLVEGVLRILLGGIFFSRYSRQFGVGMLRRLFRG